MREFFVWLRVSLISMGPAALSLFRIARSQMTSQRGRVLPMNLKVDTTIEPIEVTDASFAKEVLQSSLPVLLDCWAPWCGPCRMMVPVMEELATALTGTIKVAKLNVDENPQTAARFGIQSIPTLLLFRNGEILDQMIGTAPRAKIEAAVRRRLREQ